jgi:chromate transporter
MQMPDDRSPVGELARLFTRLGATAFGGPAAHIALMRLELVERRRWLTDQEFVDLVGAANMIPGPNSTEVAIHVGYARAGWPGLLTAGACFITPSMLMVGVLAWVYVQYGSLPDVRGVLYGVTPVVVAIIAQALWTFAHTTVKSTWLGCVCVAAVAAAVAGVHELVVLAGGAVTGFAQWILTTVRSPTAAADRKQARGLVWLPVLAAAPVAGATAAAPVTLTTLFGVFFKTGALLFGSGYVLLAFLRHDLVERLGWLTDQQLLDAVAVAQITPGPLFTTATFIGYVLAGVRGAALATIAIFLPAFVYVAVSAPWIPRLRRSPLARAILDGVNVAAVAVMGVVSWYIARAAVRDPVTIAILLVAALLLLRTRLNSVWLILGGGLVGWVARAH